MALQNNFLPQTSLVFAPRDFSQQIAQQGAADTKAVQNALAFGTKLYDFLQSNKQADLIEKDSKDKSDLQASIDSDMKQLAELKAQLAALEGGV